MGPRFTHDCIRENCCTFVGHTLRCDVYSYRSFLGKPGMIMRASSDGPDYCSYPTMELANQVAARDAEAFHAVQLVQGHLAALANPADEELAQLRAAVWMMGNNDTEIDIRAWWKTFRGVWDAVAQNHGTTAQAKADAMHDAARPRDTA